METFSVRITQRRQEAEEIVSFELRSIDGKPLPAFSAGAHIDLTAPNGMVRQYSLCNHPSEQDRYLIGVLRDPHSRGASLAMHASMREGELVQISAPRNHFALVPARRTILVAAGIGVTPILCMAEQLSAAGADFVMHYCTRSPERTAFRARIADSSFADKVHFHVDNGAAAQHLDLRALLASPAPDVHLYVCGPGGFIGLVSDSAHALGWDSAHIHVEHFGALVQAHVDDGSFDVRIASTGAVYAVPAGKTITQTLAEQGIAIPMSCEQGVCGTCITRVLDGIPDHRDMYFTDEEKACNDQFMPCCSRAKSKLLLLDL